jgi:hypothetical protein
VDILNILTNITDFNIIKDIVIPIVLSIIAAVIFWLIFDYFPNKRRYSKIRPKVEFNMYNVYKSLFNYIEVTLRYNNYSPSMFQNEIRGGILQKEDIILGLQNKCLNDSYLFDENSSLFVMIGTSLLDKVNKINVEIDKLFNFNNYLNADEILLLEKIRTKLFTYEYNLTAQTKIGNQIYTCVNPNLSYMANNIFEIYKLFLQLQNIIFLNKYFERDILLHAVQYYYHSNKYKLCKKQLQINIEKYQDCKGILQCYDFLCDYMLNRKDEAYEKIENLFKNTIDLVSNRNFFKLIIKEDRVQVLLKQYFMEADIKKFMDIINDEETLKIRYTNQALTLREHYRKKQDELGNRGVVCKSRFTNSIDGIYPSMEFRQSDGCAPSSADECESTRAELG